MSMASAGKILNSEKLVQTYGELAGVCNIGGGKEKCPNTFKYHIKDEHDDNADGEHVAEWVEEIFPRTSEWLRDNYLVSSNGKAANGTGEYVNSPLQLRLTLVHCR